MSPTAASRSAGRRTASVFAALGDETRLHLVSRLSARGPLSITRLTQGAGVSRQAVTKHLLVLAEAGLVHGARQGRERMWALKLAPLAVARHQLDAIAAQWDSTLGRLRAFVEDPPEGTR